jgi:hypothetical protein
LKSNGTGVIFYSDLPNDSEELDHEIKVEELVREIEEAIFEETALQSPDAALDDAELESIREEITTEKLGRNFFRRKSTGRSKTRFSAPFTTTANGGQEFQTTRGTVDEFTEFLELCVMTEREIISSNEDYLVVEAETEYDGAGISDCSYYTERLGELVEIACEHFSPKRISLRLQRRLLRPLFGLFDIVRICQHLFARICKRSGA